VQKSPCPRHLSARTAIVCWKYDAKRAWPKSEQSAIRHRTHGYELTRSLVARDPALYAILVQRPRISQSYEGLPVVEHELVPEVPPCAVVLAWPRDNRLSPRARELAEIARRHYG